MTGPLFKYFYIDWENGGSKFLKTSDHITFTAGAQKMIRLSVFHNRSNPESLLLLKDWKWISTHSTTTDSPDASWVMMMSSLMNERRFLAKPNVVLYLVSSNDARFMELISLIKTNTQANIIPVNSQTTSITDCLDFVCNLCLTVFKDTVEKEAHDRRVHWLLCNNPACERSKKGNGFWNESELRDHIARQRKCDMCDNSSLIFCCHSKRDEHVRNLHIRRANAARNAGSSMNQRNDEMSVVHFRYSLFPLPCYAEPTCVQRFKTTKEQVQHHVTRHHCKFPYVCMPCVDKYAQPVFLKSKLELLEHAKEMGHKYEDVLLR